MTQPFTVHLKMHPNFGSNQEKKVSEIELFFYVIVFWQGTQLFSLEFTGIDIDLS